MCLAIEVAYKVGLLGKGSSSTNLIKALDIGQVKGNSLKAIVVKDVDLGSIKGAFNQVIELAIDIPVLEHLA